MTLNTLIAEMQINRRNVENAYYGLLNLHNAMVISKEEDKEIPADKIMKILCDALHLLEMVVEEQ